MPSRIGTGKKLKWIFLVLKKLGRLSDSGPIASSGAFPNWEGLYPRVARVLLRLGIKAGGGGSNDILGCLIPRCRDALFQDTVKVEEEELDLFLASVDEGPLVAQEEDLAMGEGHPATEEELLRGIKDLPVPPQYALVTSVKARVRRLHIWLGCWRVRNLLDVEPIFNIEGLQYDSICRLCCPKGTRPGTVADPARAILVAAGISSQGLPADSDSSESSSSSDGTRTLPVKDAAVDKP